VLHERAAASGRRSTNPQPTVRPVLLPQVAEASGRLSEPRHTSRSERRHHPQIWVPHSRRSRHIPADLHPDRSRRHGHVPDRVVPDHGLIQMPERHSDESESVDAYSQPEPLAGKAALVRGTASYSISPGLRRRSRRPAGPGLAREAGLPSDNHRCSPWVKCRSSRRERALHQEEARPAQRGVIALRPKRRPGVRALGSARKLCIHVSPATAVTRQAAA
jgi:hypothetical protein